MEDAWGELKRLSERGERGSEACTFRSISRRGLNDEHVAMLTERMRVEWATGVRVRFVGLHQNKIGENGANALSRWIGDERCTIEELSLYSNRKGSFWGTTLGEALTRNRTVKVLDLGGNGIGDEGAKGLANGLRQNETLRELHLDYCDVGDDGLNALRDALRTNRTLTEFWMHGNPCARVRSCATARNEITSWLARNRATHRRRRAVEAGYRLVAPRSDDDDDDDARFHRVDACTKASLRSRARDLVACGRRAVAEIQRQRAHTTVGTCRAERLARVSARTYMSVCARHAAEWRGDMVLATVIAEDVRSSRLAVVALGVGTKFLDPNVARSERCRAGELVRDSHGEVLARRAFVRYLYARIALSDEDASSNDWRPSSSRTRYHMYVSTAPCGAASNAIRDATTTNTLLAKRGGGKGDEEKEKDAPRTCFGGCVRPTGGIDAVVGSSSSRLSCTDKVVRWCTCGLQGALPTLVMGGEPVRVSTVAVGRKYAASRCDLAIGRLVRAFQRDATDATVCVPNMVGVPSSARLEDLCHRQETSRSQGGDGDECLCWHAGMVEPTRHDGRTGKPLRHSGSRFRCSEMSTLELRLNFHAIRFVRSRPREESLHDDDDDPSSWVPLVPSSLTQLKRSAVAYTTARDALIRLRRRENADDENAAVRC